MKIIAIILVAQAVILPDVLSEKCSFRSYGKGTGVCVCNKKTCDTIEPVKKVQQGHYLQYTSDIAGKRFEKTTGQFSKKAVSKDKIVIRSREVFQKIFGFGGALTDTTCINIMSLENDVQDKLMKSYFSEEGIEYSLGRIAMAASDFSTHPYTYDDNDDKEDLTLSKFALATEDYKYKIPLLHLAKKLNNNIKFFTGTWIAPKWTTSNGKYVYGTLKENMYQVWANYFVKFLDAYKKEGIEFWAMSTGNEPSLVNLPYDIPSVGWTNETQRDWLKNNLGPTIRNSSHAGIKIMVLDDSRRHVPEFTDVIFADPEAQKYADGVAVHWYNDHKVAADILSETHKKYPNKFILYTEASQGLHSKHPFVIGNWDRGEQYATDIIENTNHWVTGWTDWNMVVNMKGGPTYIGNPIDAPILVNATAQEFLKQPMFYALGHFSKFVPPDSQSIFASHFDERIPAAAFKRPDGGIAVVIVNKNETIIETAIEDANRGAIPIKLTPRSINTIVYW